MCGLLAIYRTSDSGFENEGLAALNTMISRGPDSFGYELHDNERLFLGHRRLAILDVSPNGNQPMRSKSGRFTIIFNGEIYNHFDLRNFIITNHDQNYSWKGSSDTETICAMLDLYSFEEVITMLEGMFAICVYDHKTNSLMLARDRFGEKPLYFGKSGDEFIVTSVLDTVLASEFDNKLNISNSAVSSFLTTTYIPQSKCIIKNFHKALPGFTYKICLKSFSIKKYQYWNLIDEVKKKRTKETNIPKKEITNEDQIEQLLSLSIKKQLISDRSIGAFLSGGIDSSIICALAKNLSNDRGLKTFTIGYEDGRYSEAHYAEKIASHLGCDHQTMIVTPSMIVDAVSNISGFYDEPFADYSQVPTYLLSNLASKHVTVALTGDGGDELFGGYNRYKYFKYVKLVSKLPLPIRRILSSSIQNIDTENLDKILMPFIKADSPGIKFQKAARAFLSSTTLDYYQSTIGHGVAKKHLAKKLNANYRQDIEDYYKLLNDFKDEEKLMLLDCFEYMPSDILVKVDRASMASSLECRAPFLDPSLASTALSLPLSAKIKSGETKIIIKKILSKYIPQEYFERPKMGFGFPLDQWLRFELKEWAESFLFDNSKIENDLFIDSSYVTDIWSRHLNGQNLFAEIWTIIMLKSWLKERGFL